MDTAVTSDSLQRVDRAIWLAIGAIGSIDIMAAIAGPFVIAWTPLVLCIGLCGLLAGAGYIYRHVRREEQIASVFIGITQMLSLAIASVGLSYVAAAAAFPSWDATLMAWDRHLGLNWMAWLRFMEAHPYWRWPLQLAYSSLIVQPFVFVVALVAARQFVRLRVLIASTTLTMLVVIAVSVACPAAGPGLDPGHAVAWPRDFAPASWVSWPVFSGLRDGTYRHLFTPDAQGIVQFPSYHAAAGLLGIFAMWPVRYVRWMTLVLNLALIASTPVNGGHYFVDVFAGLVLAALCWKAAARMIEPRHADDRSEIVVEAPSIVPAAPGSRARIPAPHYTRTEAI